MSTKQAIFYDNLKIMIKCSLTEALLWKHPRLLSTKKIFQMMPYIIIVRLFSRYTGSIFGPVPKSIRYNVSITHGNGTGPVRSEVELFTPYRIDMFWIDNIRIYVQYSFQKQPSLESKRVITRFRYENESDPLNSPFTLGAERSIKLSDTERITFKIGAFQLVIVPGIVLNHRGQL